MNESDKKDAPSLATTSYGGLTTCFVPLNCPFSMESKYSLFFFFALDYNELNQNGNNISIIAGGKTVHI